MNAAPQLSSIGKYRLIASLGHGGMANIHLAVMAGIAGFNKLLVIKTLRDDVGGTGPNEEFVAMFLDEARLAARLNHPNIVQTYEVGESDGGFFIAMEYLEGQPMKSVERRLMADGLPSPVLLRILSETAKGLHHAHELRGFDGEPLGVVHRDVSPHNVFLTYDGQVKLLDFGIAKASDAMHLTKVGVIKGKAAYIAPEQIRGENVDRRADIFALGVMMWEGLARRPFAGGSKVSDITKMHNRLTGGEPRLRVTMPELPERLTQICDKALALRPEDRYATAAELAEDIDAYLADSSLYPNAAQLSQLLTPLFQTERDQIRKLIDEQMKRALDPSNNLDGHSGQLPVLRNNNASGVWPMPPQGTGGLTPTGMRMTSGSQPSLPSPLAESTSLPTAASGGGVERKKTFPWAVAIGLVVAVGAAVMLLAPRPHPENAQGSAPMRVVASEPAVAENPAALPTSPEPSAAERPKADNVHVRIIVDPEKAQISLDGARVTTIPFDAEMERSKQMRTLEVSAPGYVSQRKMVTFDRDLDVSIVLERDDGPRRFARPHSARPSASAGSASAPSGNEPAAPQTPGSATKSATVDEPGQDLRRLTPGRAASRQDVELEEDPYR